MSAEAAVTTTTTILPAATEAPGAAPAAPGADTAAELVVTGAVVAAVGATEATAAAAEATEQATVAEQAAERAEQAAEQTSYTLDTMYEMVGRLENRLYELETMQAAPVEIIETETISDIPTPEGGDILVIDDVETQELPAAAKKRHGFWDWFFGRS